MFAAESELPLPLEHALRWLVFRLQEATRRAVRASDLPVEPSWLPVYAALADGGERSVTELARRLDQRHPSLLQVLGRMSAAGWLDESPDAADARRRLVRLSGTAMAWRPRVERLLAVLQDAQSELFSEVGFDVERAARVAKAALGRRDVLDRARQLAGEEESSPTVAGGVGGSEGELVRAPQRSDRAPRRRPSEPPPDFEVWR